MISVEEAKARILAAFAPVSAEQVPLSDGLGRVLAEDLKARRTQPPKSVSAMDGYAVRAADVAKVPTVLHQVGAVPAGSSYDKAIHPGETVRIFTGAPVPEGADTIVIQENTEATGDRITVKETVAAGRHIRVAGLDFREGATILKAGRALTSRDIGLAAAMNIPWLPVRRRPRIAILPTGDEVVMPGDPVGPNQIVSSNGPSLAAFVTACGGMPTLMGVAPDDADALRSMAAAAKGADLLLTSGGASVGDHDLVKDALGAEGLVIDFWKIAMRPGKPLIFGRMGGVPVLGLPGNPVSSLVCALLFVKPAMEAMLGVSSAAPAPMKARLGVDLPGNDQRQDYLRASLARGLDGGVVTPFKVQDSSMVSVVASADCLIIRKPHAPPAKKGEEVEIIPLHGGIVSV